MRLFFISSLPFPLALSLSLRVKFYFHSLFQLSFLIVQGRDINVLNSILAFLLELLLSSQSEIAPQSIQLIYPHHFPFHMRLRELNFHFYSLFHFPHYLHFHLSPQSGRTPLSLIVHPHHFPFQFRLKELDFQLPCNLHFHFQSESLTLFVFIFTFLKDNSTLTLYTFISPEFFFNMPRSLHFHLSLE